MNGVFAIAGAEKWTYANHCTNSALNAVFPNYNVTAAATKEDVDKLEEPLVKMVQELDMLSSYTAGPSGKVERGSEYINSTVTGYRMDAITLSRKTSYSRLCRQTARTADAMLENAASTGRE